MITQEIADRIPQAAYQAIKSPGHAQLVKAFTDNNWRSTDTAKNKGGLGPSEFLDALVENPNKVLLDPYTLKSISEARKQNGLRIFQLGDGKVFFGIKNGNPATSYDLDPARYGFSDADRTLTLVLNGEGNAPGMLTAVMVKALEEGITALIATQFLHRSFLLDSSLRFTSNTGLRWWKPSPSTPRFIRQQSLPT